MNTLRSRLRDLTRGRHSTSDEQVIRRAERGQVLPIFVMMSVVLLGGAALLADAAWWWTMEQRMQRAADAGALAGAVFLPDQQAAAFQSAIEETRKNGFTHGQDGVIVSPRRDPINPRKLIVDIDAPVETFFAKVFNLVTVDVGVTGAAEYTLPVPMGSPENYYGVFGTVRDATFTEETTVSVPRTSDGGDYSPSDSVSGTWDNPDNAFRSGYTGAGRDGESQVWGDFGLLADDGIPDDPSVEMVGLEVQLRDTARRNGAAGDDCRLKVAVSRDLDAGAGATWSADVQTDRLRGSDRDYRVGDAGSLAEWGGGTWTRDDFADGQLGVRLTWEDGSAACPTSRWVRVGELEVIPHYRWTETVTEVVTTTTNDLLRGPGAACASGAAGCFDPDGPQLNERGFWATMNTRGAANVNGDAHQPYYITPTTVVAPECSDSAADGNACYDPEVYYNYAVEMPPGSSGGYVYVFDPGFCQTDSNKGVGDRWFGGSDPVSSWYELYEDTRNTPYDYSDDTRIASSGSLFTNMDATDTTMVADSDNEHGQAECAKNDTGYGDGRDYHLSWYLLNPGRPLSGGANGRVYRLHTTNTDPSGSLVSDANGEQSFALYARADGGAPRIYGLAAMQMYTPLRNSGGASSSEFYLAQIDSAHAGKVVELKLWDPGDTGPLRANLQVLLPQEAGGWAPSSEMTYSAQTGTTHPSINTACNSNASSTPVSQILTNEGNNVKGEFNGCWLTVHIPIPPDYTGREDGWWKMRYNMTGSGTSNDVTTWKVAVLGNPVHLTPE